MLGDVALNSEYREKKYAHIVKEMIYCDLLDRYDNLFSKKYVENICRYVTDNGTYNIYDPIGCCFNYLIKILQNNDCFIFENGFYIEKIYSGIFIPDRNILICSIDKTPYNMTEIKLDKYYRSI